MVVKTIVTRVYRPTKIMFRGPHIVLLVGGFNPSEKKMLSVGMMIFNIWKIIQSCSSHYQADWIFLMELGDGHLVPAWKSHMALGQNQVPLDVHIPKMNRIV